MDGASSSSYQGGAGGKFPKKPSKKPHTTPYDRPALPNPNGGGGGWVSKLVMEPASKLIHAGANIFFSSSLFHKRLTNTIPSGANQESTNTFQETVNVQRHQGDKGPKLKDRGKRGIPEGKGVEIKDSGKEMTASDSSRLSELELLLKRKTFTRSEVDHLTKLLHTRTAEANGDGERSTEFPQGTVSASGGQDILARSSLQDARKESHLDNQRFSACISTPVVSSKVDEENIASPAEIAKAYMDKRSKVSPSVLGLRSQALREDSGLLSNSPFPPRSPALSLLQKPTIHGGVPENGFATPRSLGRTAISSMARTPYSRSRISSSRKDNGSMYDGNGGFSASSLGFARDLVSRSVSKDSALKRRSSALDDEIGSVGPIRRLRQKTNLSTPNIASPSISRTPFSVRGTGIASDGTPGPSSSSKTFHDGDNKRYMPGRSYTLVPTQSQETARKILQQLEKLTPKKEKKLDDKVGASSESSPGQLMPNMLNGQALRSLKDAESSKVLQDAAHSLKSSQKSLLPDACETSSSPKHKSIEENGRKSFNVCNGSLALSGISNGPEVSTDSVPVFSFSGSVEKQLIPQSSKKKWGFQMSAREEGEIHTSEAVASAKPNEGRQILEISAAVKSDAVPVTENKVTSFSEVKAPIDLGTSDGTRVLEKSSGFMFSAVPTASTSLPSGVSLSQSTSFTKNITEKQPNAPPPLFSSGGKADDKISSYTFSSSPFVGGSFSLKSSAASDVKEDITNSLLTNATETVPKPTDTVNDSLDKQKPADVLEKPGSVFSFPQSTSPSTSLFVTGSTPSFLSPSNGSLNPTTPSSFPSPLSVLSTSESEILTAPSPFSGFSFSQTNMTAAASSKQTPSTSATPSFLSASAFKFDTSSLPITFNTGTPFMAPSTYLPVSSTSTSTDVKISSEKETGFGNQPSNPFGAMPLHAAGTGSSIFGFSAGSTSSTSAANISQGSLFGTSGSSALSSAMVSSASTPSTTGGSLFVSSTSSAPASGNTTSSSFVFGNNSITNPSPFSSSTSSSSPFGFSKDLGPSPSSGLTTSAPPSTGFIFGASTTAASSSSPFSFSFAAQSQPVFGSSVVPAFASVAGNSSGQLAMADDSMAEDVVQVGPTPTPSLPVFGQPPVSNPSASPFMFGSTTPSSSGVNPFQFSGQPVSQNPDPIQPSGIVHFGGVGSSFSLGSSGGGGDKSARRIIRVKRRK